MGGGGGIGSFLGVDLLFGADWYGKQDVLVWIEEGGGTYCRAVWSWMERLVPTGL